MPSSAILNTRNGKATEEHISKLVKVSHSSLQSEAGNRMQYLCKNGEIIVKAKGFDDYDTAVASCKSGYS